MNLELLRQVCVTPGAPGFEDKIRDFIIQEVAPLVDAVRVDNMGSVIAIVEGKNTEKTMMAAAHMDGPSHRRQGVHQIPASGRL